ncbi:hypothetical protein JL720_6771 [Aureococcus anophagefferens]|nr:hypothetical protein JL720_6771 [Aureococcus anophagefferens]
MFESPGGQPILEVWWWSVVTQARGHGAMAEQWYYVDGAGGQAGPVDVDGLKGLLKSNDITMETLVWCDGQGDWEGIDDLPALKARVKPKSKPPPPPVPAKKAAPPPPPAAKAAHPPRRRSSLDALKVGDAGNCQYTGKRRVSGRAMARASANAHWVEKVTVDGVAYYHNAALEKVTYDKPDELKSADELKTESGSWVWVRDDAEAWLPARVVSKLGQGTVKVQMRDSGKGLTLKQSDNQPLWPLTLSSLGRLEDDLVMLDSLNQAAMVHDLKERYKSDDIYTRVAVWKSNLQPDFNVRVIERWVGASHTVLVSINPFKRLPIYGVNLMREFAEPAPNRLLPPHPFAVANGAYLRLRVDAENQAILISGESGAGKTEATKQCLSFLAEVAGSTNNVEQRVLSANPVLEAFGNAKTVRNNNSSRFGRWMEVHFDNRGAIASARRELPPRSRASAPGQDERSYHVFYQLGLSGRHASSGVAGTSAAHGFLSLGSADKAAGVDDAADFRDVESALEQLAFDDAEVAALFSLTAGCLRVGDIEFAPAGDGSAAGARALAKAAYGRLFDWLVKRINVAVAQGGAAGGKFIGVLDIFGFEIFESNSFEQLCINYTNEKLQQHFNRHTFKEEENLYRSEGIDFEPVPFIDNQPVLDLIEKKPDGLLLALDDVVNAPQGSDAKWMARCEKSHAAKKEWVDVSEKHKGSRGRGVKQKGDEEFFTVRHYAGAVTYHIVGFCEKNKDPLGRNLYDLLSLKAPAFPLVGKELFPDLGRNPRRQPTIAGQFRKQLSALMKIVDAADPCYVRCVKPNQQKKARLFDAKSSIEQMTYAGVFEAVKIRKSGYPFRLPHRRFAARYRPLVAAHSLGDGSDRDKCRALLKNLNQDFGAVKMGATMVLYRSPEHRVLELLRNLALEKLVPKAQRGARAGMGRRYLAVLKRVKADLKTLLASPRANDAKALDRADRRFALQERLDLDPLFKKLAAASNPSYQDLADGVRRADKIKDVPGTPEQMALEKKVREKLLTLAKKKIDPIAKEAAAILDEDLMRTVAEDAANACYENEDVLEIKKYLAMPADKLIKEQLKRAKATDDPDRVVNREIKLKALMLETFGASFSFEKVAALRDASDWASRKSFFSSAATRASLAEGFLVYDSRPIHLALTEPPADYAEKKKFDKKAVNLFKGLLGFMGCTKHPYPETLCAEALETALNDPAPHPLRLELYCQLMKQLSGAAAGDVQTKAWDFLAVAFHAFPPPTRAGFDNVVAYFISKNAPPEKKEKLTAALHAGVYGGARATPIKADAIPNIIASTFGGEISARFLDHDLIKAGASKVPPPPPPSAD